MEVQDLGHKSHRAAAGQGAAPDGGAGPQLVSTPWSWVTLILRLDSTGWVSKHVNWTCPTSPRTSPVRASRCPHIGWSRSGDLRVGVLGIIGREQAGACTFKAVVPAINTSISAMGEVDLVVVLSHQDASAERSMAAAVPAVDVVVNGHSKGQTPRPSHSASPQSSWAQAAAGRSWVSPRCD